MSHTEQMPDWAGASLLAAGMVADALARMPYGISAWDTDHRLVYWNDAYLRFYGLSSESVFVGMTLAERIALAFLDGNDLGETPDEMVERHRQRHEMNTDPANPVVYVDKVGDRFIERTYLPSPGRGWVVIHEDETEQLAREAQLSRQNMLFNAAVNHMAQGLCMFDADSRLIICNKRFLDLYDLPPELGEPGTSMIDILNHRVARGFHGKDGPEAYIDRRLQLVASRRDAVDTVELLDGRTIFVIHHPLPDGGWVTTHEDVTAQKQAEIRIRHYAQHDALTDLPNRMQFRERMEAAEARVAEGEAFALLFIDLDHFKAVNDFYGHAIGDRVLKQVSERLLAACRSADIVARIGGDEFAVLQSALGSPEDAAALAERIVGALASPFSVNGHEITIGASIGIALAPDDGRTAETLMKNADLAAYRAKADGRGVFHFFEPGMDVALQERLVFEMELRGALGRNELVLVFQPLFSLADNRISSVEALLRWNHPVRGLITPERIIPAAEKSGLIGPIGEWVLREACIMAATWPEHISIAVNVSPVQFAHRNLIRHVEEALRISGIDPRRLDIEVTESALLANSEMALSMLEELRRLGVRISLDDFGTGYSSLGYLRLFAFDKIKIDRSFVHDLAKRGDSLAIIKAVISLGRSLGISTTAEGVETEEQFDLVRDEGCTEVQGYIFSPPLPASAISDLLTRKPPLGRGYHANNIS